MLKTYQWAGTLAGLSLLLGGNGAIALTSMEWVTTAPETHLATPHQSPPQEFKTIEQPLPVKLGITAVGVSLIGLELWWFLWSKPKPKHQPRMEHKP